MDIIEAIIQKSQALSREHQLEVLRYIDSLSEKTEKHESEENAKKNQTIKMKFEWAGALAELNQTAMEVQKEILTKRSE